MRNTHATPGSGTGARQRPQIAAFEFARIDVALNLEAYGMHERGDVVDSESVDITKPSPPVGEPTGAVAAVVAIDERSRHIIEQDRAARAAVRRDQREDCFYRVFRKVVGDAFPQEQ